MIRVNLAGCEKYLEITIILIVIMLIYPIIVFASSSETYIIGFEITIKNEGEKPYPLNDFRKIILIPENNYQKLISFRCMINETETSWRMIGLNDEGNIEVELMNIPEEVLPKTQLTFKFIIEAKISKKRPPQINVSKAGSITDIPRKLTEKYCVMKGLWAKSFNVSLLARKLIKNETNVLKILFILIKWIENNIEYPDGREPKIPSYPDETLNMKVGDCDDQANLLVAMCRAINIPAYTQLAFIFMEGRRMRREGLFEGRLTIEAVNLAGHGWALVYIPPWGWIPVDMTFYKGAIIKDKKIISSKIEDHIIGASTFHYVTLVTENIIYSDYIKDLNEWLKDLDEYNLRWTEKYWMEMKVKRAGDGIVLASIICLILLTTSTILIYIYVRRKRREK